MLDRLSFLLLLAIPTVACTSTSRMSMEASPAFDIKVVERDGSRIVDLKVVQRHALSEVVAAINGRFSGMDRAQVALQIPQDPRIATVELRLLTEWQ